MQSSNPLVSVILPVYNGELYLGDSIQSILDQTYVNFELLILSSPNTNQASLDVIDKFNDPRIRHIRRSPEQNNLPKALNMGIDKSRGIYVARMDADDMSLPQRLQKEVEFMEKDKDVSIAGSWAKAFGLKSNYIKHPTDPEEIRVNLLFQSSLVHPTVIFRKEMLDQYHLRYDPELNYCEDIDFWIRASKYLKIANIPEVLLLYRTHNDQASRRKLEEQDRIRKELRKTLLSRLQIIPTEEELELYKKLCIYEGAGSNETLDKISQWLEKLDAANDRTHQYDAKILKKVLGGRWFIICYASRDTLKKQAWEIFWSRRPSTWFKKDLRNIFRLLKFYIKS